MKRYKFIVIAALAIVSIATLANTYEFKANPDKRVINVSILEALKVPGLATQMYMQLDESILLNNQLVYTKYVLLKTTYYRISGTREQWDLFFRHRIDVEQQKVKQGNEVL